MLQLFDNLKRGDSVLTQRKQEKPIEMSSVMQKYESRAEGWHDFSRLDEPCEKAASKPTQVTLKTIRHEGMLCSIPEDQSTNAWLAASWELAVR